MVVPWLDSELNEIKPVFKTFSKYFWWTNFVVSSLYYLLFKPSIFPNYPHQRISFSLSQIYTHTYLHMYDISVGHIPHSTPRDYSMVWGTVMLFLNTPRTRIFVKNVGSTETWCWWVLHVQQKYVVFEGFWGAPSWRCARLPNKFSYTTMECNCGRIFCTHRARQRQSIFRFPQSIHMQRVCYQSECLTHLPTQENETCFSWTNETDNPNNAQIYSFVLVQTIDHVWFLGLSYKKVISCELVRRGWPVFNRTTERGRGLVEIRVS